MGVSKRGMDIRTVQEQLGLKDVRTTKFKTMLNLDSQATSLLNHRQSGGVSKSAIASLLVIYGRLWRHPSRI